MKISCLLFILTIFVFPISRVVGQSFHAHAIVGGAQTFEVEGEVVNGVSEATIRWHNQAFAVDAIVVGPGRHALGNDDSRVVEGHSHLEDDTVMTGKVTIEVP